MFYVAAIKCILPKKVPFVHKTKLENTYAIKEEQNALPDYTEFMTIEECNEFYKKKSVDYDKCLNETNHFSKIVNDIFSEMYVNTIFVSNCQHMVELCGNIYNF